MGKYRLIFGKEISNKDDYQAIKDGSNIFEIIMIVSKNQTLGQITDKLFKLGGEYRRNM